MRIDPIIYNITILAGEDYSINFQYTDDDEVPVNMSGWGLEATLREKPESKESFDFLCICDETGMHMYLQHADTERISYSHGQYDVFVIDPDNNIRAKLVSGDAYIIPRSTR